MPWSEVAKTMKPVRLIRFAFVFVGLAIGGAEGVAAGGNESVKCMDRCDLQQTRCLRQCSRSKGCKQKCTDQWDQCHKACGGG